MQLISLFLGLIFGLHGVGADASPVCDVIESIQQLHFAQQRLAQSPSRQRTSPDRNLVLRETNKLTSGYALFQIGAALSDADKVLIFTSLRNSKQIAQALRLDDVDALRALTTNSGFVARASRIEHMLPRFGCQTSDPTGTRSGKNTAVTPLSIQVRDAIKDPRLAIGVPVIIALFVALLWHLVRRLRAAMKLKERRAKRYDLYLPTQFMLQNTKRRGEVLDISCNGVKLRHGQAAPDIGDTISIWILDDWQKGRVSWANEHYCGVNFLIPMLGSQIRRLRNQRAPQKLLSEPKTAPL